MSQDFLGSMQTTVIGKVESVTRYDIEGSVKGGVLWVTKPTSGRNPNVLGSEIIKIKMPFEMFDQLRAKQETGEIQLPAMMEILCDIDMGGQNRASLIAISIRKHIVNQPHETSKKSDSKAVA